MKRRDRARRRFAAAVLAAATPVVLVAPDAMAGTKYFTGLLSWNNGGNWSTTAGGGGGAGVPAGGDDVFITDTSISRNVNYDYSGAAVTLHTLTIDNTSGNNAFDDSLSMSTSSNNLTVTSAEIVAVAGTGTFIQTGGINQIGSAAALTSNSFGDLILGQSTAGVGTYTLNGSSAVLNVYGEELVDNSTFNQSSGTNNTYQLSFHGGSSPSYNLSGGSLNVGTIGSDSLALPGEFIFSEGGTTIFNQTGGTHTVGSAADFAAFSAGNLGLENLGLEIFAATYNLSDANGPATVHVYADELVGGSTFSANIGTFVQTGSTTSNIVAGNLHVGDFFTATYTLNSGSVSAGGEIVGGEYDQNDGPGTGTFTQTGGSNQVGGTLVLAAAFGSTGTYKLSGTGQLSASGEQIGGQVIDIVGGGGSPMSGGVGTFVQSGGTNTVSGTANHSFYIFNGSSYTLSGGTLNLPATVGAAENNGAFTLSGTGILKGILLNQIPISNDFSGNLLSGMVMTGGTVDAAATVYNEGGFAVTGGNFNGMLFNTSESNVSQTAGTIAGTVINNGSMTQSGGLVSGTVSNNGQYVVSGGTFKATGANGGPQNTASGNFMLQGGTLDVSGTSSGKFVNQGTFGYTGGTFTGALLNQGTANIFPISGAFSNGAENDATISIGTTGGFTSVSFGSPGLDNNGGLFMGSATISGTILNDYAGTLSYFSNATSATINGPLTNLGYFTPGIWTVTGAVGNAGRIYIQGSNGLNAVGGLTNSGSIELAGGRLTGGAIANNPGGVIQFDATGGTVYGFSQEFNNAGGVIILQAGTQVTLSSFDGNTAGGDIQIQSGATLTLPAFGNSGTIELQGANAALNGHQIINGGSITGQGRISNPISNGQGSITGIIEASGGKLTVSSSGSTNGAGSQILIDSGATIQFSQGLASSSGTITNSGGTFDNNSQPLSVSSSGIINGYGTFRTGGTGISSAGLITLAGGTSNVFGPVTNNSGGTAIVQNGSVFFNSPVTNNGSFRVISGATATFAGGFSGGSVTNGAVFSNAGALVMGGNFNNSGTATIGGTQSWAGGTTFNNTAGSATFSTDAGSSMAATLAINASGGSVTFGSTQHLASVSLSGGATASVSASGDKVVRANAILIGAGSKIDLSDNKLVTQSAVGSWNGSAYTGVLGLAASGRITTSQALAASGLTTIAVAANSDLHKTTFGGESVGSSDVLVMYTYAGDVNLDGKINGDDYFPIDQGFSGHLTGYENGDLNYDGRVDADDYFIIDKNYVKQAGNIFPSGEPVVGDGAAIDSMGGVAAASTGSVQAVPEPGALGIAALGMGLGARRRRSTKLAADKQRG